MRYALILAGGSGTRLWPMSTASKPKQLIPFVNGRSLLQIAFERLEGLVEKDKRFICAGNSHKDMIIEGLEGFNESQFIGEPDGRDTLNALAYSSAVLRKLDPDAVIAVFTADHIIEPVDEFLRVVEKGFRTAEDNEKSLVTFGITPTYAATGFGYLELGLGLSGGSRRLRRFREKPVQADAQDYYSAGPENYLWNSGMFIWRADTLLECVEKYEPECYRGIMKIVEALESDSFDDVLNDIYPGLKKISIDFAVMEPASGDPDFTVAAVPMPLTWLDIGSWSAYAGICEIDAAGNNYGIKNHLLLESSGTLLASEDEDHLIAGIGLEDLIVIHTSKATLICPKNRDQEIKKLYSSIEEKYGDVFI
ncbi:MAG: NTP transferase domain-containing protein [Spirochaetales bacterium]|nr:NTP transferase domain-containing protein [Spirochaetales bacterium]